MDRLARLKQFRDATMMSVTDLPDDMAAKIPSMYEPWAVDTEYKEGDRRSYGELLYKCRQAHTSQADWTPDKTPAIWAVVSDGSQAGTIDNPITAAKGMEYTYGLYYLDPEDNHVYLCKRIGEEEGGTIILQYLPHDLIGQYFELVK